MMHRRLAHFEIQQRIGQGGMGVVYRARDTHLGRTVAVKILPPSVASEPERRSRFLREAQAAANLNHPVIATVYQFGSATASDPEFAGPDDLPEGQEVLFLAMEYVEGEDLQHFLAQGPLQVEKVLRYALQISDGLSAAHAAGVIHRDLKPNNVRITPDGRVKLLDFGLAKIRQEIAGLNPPGGPQSFHTTRGMLMGTPPYMAPEQLQDSDVDHRCDLFSFGVVLYEMLSGATPYPSGSLLEYVRALSSSPARPLDEVAPQVPTALSRVVMKLLEQKPEARYDSAAEVARDLERAAREVAPADAEMLAAASPGATPAQAASPKRPTPGTVAAITPPPEPSARRRSRRLGLAGALLVALLVAAGAWWWARDAERTPAAAGTERPLTVALLPFEVLSDEPPVLTLGRRLTTALLGKLARLDGVEVLEASPTDATGPALDADATLRGELQPAAGDDLRATLTLLEQGGSLVLWNQSWSGSRDELAGREDRIADQARAVLVTWQRLGEDRALGAEDFQALGRELLVDERRCEEPLEALVYFDLATQRDEDFAPAFAARSLALRCAYASNPDEALLDRAERDARRAIDLAPDSPAPRTALGRALLTRGLYEDALEQFELAAEDESARAEALFDIGILYLQMNRPRDSMRALEQALELDPENWDYYNQLGLAHLGARDRERARQSFERAAELAPQGIFWPLNNLVFLAYQEADLEAAASYGDRIRRPLMDPELATNLGTTYYALGQLDKAERDFRRAVELEPREAIFQRNLGDVLEAEGKSEEATAAYRSCVELLERELRVKSDGETVALLALCRAELGDCETAVELLDEHRAVELGRWTDAWNLAQAEISCERPRRALEALSRAVELGAEPSAMAAAPEFASLRGNEGFERLVGAER